MLPQYLKSLEVALLGVRDAQDKYWFDFQNTSRRETGGRTFAWAFPLHCKNTREQAGNCSRVVPAYSPFAETHSGTSFAVHGETRLGAVDAAAVFSRNVTEGAAWPPVLLLRMVVRYVNPLFGAGTPRTIDDVSCVAVGKGRAEKEKRMPAVVMAFSCRTNSK